jgi:hypothetical protein
VSAKKKSQRGFVAVTLITLLAIALVIIAYATILGTFKGGNVTVVGVQAQIWYNPTNNASASWTNTLSDLNNGTQWYARLNITSGGYTGHANVTWTLYNATSDTVISGSPTVSTVNFDITGVGSTIYASTTGANTGNTNWGSYTGVVGPYYIKAVISKS